LLPRLTAMPCAVLTLQTSAGEINWTLERPDRILEQARP